MSLFTLMAASWRERLRSFRTRRETPLDRLRREWGHGVERERNFLAITMLHDRRAPGLEEVDERTWEDLAMDEVFARVDRTQGYPGRQVLYHQMRTYEADPAVLAERTRQQQHFRSHPAQREAIQLRLQGLDGTEAAFLAPLLKEELPPKPPHAWLLVVCAEVFGALLAGIPFLPILLVPAILMGFVNMMVNETLGRRMGPHFGGLGRINRLLWMGEALAKVEDPAKLPQLETLRNLSPSLAALRRSLAWLAVDRERLDDFSLLVIGYLNLFFLLDLLSFARSVDLLRRHQAEAFRVLEAVGSLDAAIAVASFAEGLPCVTVPRIAPGRTFSAEGLRHPLLASPVGNPLELEGRSALITGSNMAGKTTFIRTAGINLILGRTLHLCLAERAVLPEATVRSSIRREDRLVQGESYFFAELERIRAMLLDAETGRPHLFLIDEIFRGTNTLERVAASVAVLRDLAREQLVLVTTHDVELQDLLADAFDMFHFSERIVDGHCGFDYAIQAGPARSRNAIRLLELQGFPERVTRAAREAADFLSQPEPTVTGRELLSDIVW
jgi:hypothetical protein